RVIRIKKSSRNCEIGYRWKCDRSYYNPVVETVDVESPAFTSGLRSGDFIMSINGLRTYDRAEGEIAELFDRVDMQQQLIVISAAVADKLGYSFKRIPTVDNNDQEGNDDDKHSEKTPINIIQGPPKISNERFGARVIVVKRESALDVFGYGWLADSSFFPLVSDVDEGSPATRAGLKAGHRILRINGAIAFGRTADLVTALFPRREIEERLLVIDDREVEEWFEKNRESIAKEMIEGRGMETIVPIERDQYGPRVIRLKIISPSHLFGYLLKADPIGYPKVTRVVDNSPASQSGLIAGDEIVSINGFHTFGCTCEEVQQLLDRCGVQQQLVVMNEKARDGRYP
ncbi:hypothetical protein PFISCL1PPCAC_21390, partial [Pristionchus fissidentatus]